MYLPRFCDLRSLAAQGCTVRLMLISPQSSSLVRRVRVGYLIQMTREEYTSDAQIVYTGRA